MTPKENVQMFLATHAPSDPVFKNLYIRDLVSVITEVGEEDFYLLLKEELE